MADRRAPVPFVSDVALVSGWGAVLLDRLLARHLPSEIGNVTPAARDELLALREAVACAAEAFTDRATSDVGTPEVPARADLSSFTFDEDEELHGPTVTITEAAAMMAAAGVRLSPRWLRSLAPSVGGHRDRVGGPWLLPRSSIEALIDERRAA